MVKFIDLFAGIGGIRTGFMQANEALECVFTSEIDRYAVQTYQENFGPENIHGDITTIDEKDVPAHDILLAGFPCQAFSIAGLRKGFEDTRGTLFFDVARIAAFHKPKVIFLENVKGFVNHDKGKTFATIRDILEEMGYKLYYKILNAKDYGVPQNRERIYIVGFLDHDAVFEFPEKSGLPTRLGDILEKNVSGKYTISDRLWAGHQRRKLEHREKGNGFGYSLFDIDSVYTSTISARYYKDGSEILVARGEGNNPRKLTPRECARLQGFPENFQIPVSDNQAYRQFGNSVAVPVIRSIAEKVFETLDSAAALATSVA